jgi:hypothetical protein
MIALLTASAIGVAIIASLAMLLPCKACQARRERMRAAYARWRETHPEQKN